MAPQHSTLNAHPVTQVSNLLYRRIPFCSRPTTPNPPRAVFFDGPQPDQDHEGEELPVWIVYVGTEEAEPVGTVYHVYNFARAQALAERIAKDRRLELIHEAMPA